MKRQRGLDEEVVDDHEDPQKHSKTVKATKRIRSLGVLFSEELLLEVLSFLPPPDLLGCRQVCRKWNRLVADESLWRRLYIESFGTLRRRPLQGWLTQYKLEHNWQRGRCRARKISFDQPANKRSKLNIAVKGDQVFSVGYDFHLNIHTKSGDLVASAQLDITSSFGKPCALLATKAGDSDNDARVFVGSETGNVGIILWNLGRPTIQAIMKMPAMAKEPVRSFACAGNTLCVLSGPMRLWIYRLGLGDDTKLLFSCNAATSNPNLISVDARKRGNETCVSIACLRPVLLQRWCPYIQELRFNDEGVLTCSRTAFASDAIETPCPSKVKYQHPYFVTASASNTIYLHTVNSRRNIIDIRPRGAMWGHCAAVADVDVMTDGRAVSIGHSASEIRGWNFGRNQQSCVIVAVHDETDPIDAVSGILRIDHHSVIVGGLSNHAPAVAVYDFSLPQ